MISLYAAAALFSKIKITLFKFMDPGSPVTKTVLCSVQTSPISSKNEVSQNGASEPVIRHLYPQVNKEACPVSPQIRTPQAPLPPPRLPPPAPPPPPPFSSLPHRGVGSCCRLSQQANLKRNRACISEDVVEMWDRLFHEKGGADVIICTDDGGTFLAHSSVLMSASPIFSSCIDKCKGRKRAVYSLRLRGVPSAAASAFIRLIYSSRFDTADMKKFVLHLLVLSHVYDTPFIKKLCTRELELGLLTMENVIDIFQLARLCDASRLSLMCLRLIIKDFKSVARTEGWRVMKEANPSLEQELLEAVVDADTKKQERARKMEEEKVYGQLRDAMEALVHICRDGCRTIGPHDRSFEGRQLGPCKFPACKGLESLVRHFAGCTIKVPGGCVHCKRMWQLLELHSRMCNEGETCRVPLCRHFKDKPKKDEAKWRLLVMKVMTAKRKTHVFSLATVSARLEEE